MTDISCVTVSVGCGDLLSVSLPWNARHFTRVVVATTPEDAETRAVVASVPNASCHLTRAFYERGASFNKGLALEQAFDAVGRSGWVLVLDSDILTPRVWPAFEPRVGCLYTPRRRMLEELPVPFTPPPENEWSRYPLHLQQVEWAGYFQLVSADDPVLASRPWYETDYTHAGTVDSLFQAKWPASRKLRPPFEVLHLGPSGVNWLGRASPRLDGTVPEGAAERVAALRRLIRQRTPGPDRFARERLP